MRRSGGGPDTRGGDGHPTSSPAVNNTAAAKKGILQPERSGENPEKRQRRDAGQPMLTHISLVP
jgi:hypothetical protein